MKCTEKIIRHGGTSRFKTVPCGGIVYSTTSALRAIGVWYVCNCCGYRFTDPKDIKYFMQIEGVGSVLREMKSGSK